MEKCQSVAVWTFALLIGCAAPTLAQFDRGSISGTIKDQQNSVMPDLTVTATHTQTQQPHLATTDSSGFYVFPNLLPKQYDVVAELQGFKKTSRTNIMLDTTSTQTINFALQTGTINEEVTITNTSPLL